MADVQRPIRFAYLPSDDMWKGNELFREHHPHNTTGQLDRWVAARRILATRGIDFNTDDVFARRGETPHVWLLQEPTRSRLKDLVVRRIPMRRTIVALTEPRVINPWAWKRLRWWAPFFGAVLTWDPEVCAGRRRFVEHKFPVFLEWGKHDVPLSQKRKPFVMVRSNKQNDGEGQLYSLRRDLIRYFERRGDALLDLFGKGWNDAANPAPFHTSLYQGLAAEKRATYAQYYYTLCIDNNREPGYINYDIPMSICGGSVPVYVPHHRSDQYVPKDVYLNPEEFPNLDALTQRALELVRTGEYEAYRERGRRFLRSDAGRHLTVEAFADALQRCVHLALPRSSNGILPTTSGTLLEEPALST